MTKILVGADPELFVKQDGKHVSGWGLIPGDKIKPHKVDKGAVQVDGMALEFNIDPAENEQEFITNLDTVVGILKKMVPEHEVVADPVAHFTKEYMSTQPFQALELGCEPDFNAWTGKVNVKPDVDLPFRTGAGHIHVGVIDDADVTNKKFFEVCCDAVREMDLFVGLPSLFYDNDEQRREMYGKAGAFRAKKYGFEYRTLSNAWLRDDKIKRWVYQATQKCVKGFLDGNRLADKYAKTVDLQEIINSSNKKEAAKIIKDAKLLMPA
jgi:hypothetical protein